MDYQNPGAATGPDLSRQGATDNDTDFSLSLEEVAEHYHRAGHPRTLRSLQRYCVSGHLDARKIATALGDKYLVTPQSVARHIAQIAEFAQLDFVATGRDMSRHVATEKNGSLTSNDGATGEDRQRQQTSTNHPDDARQGTTYSDGLRHSATDGNGFSRDSTRHENATGDDSVRQGTTHVAHDFSSERFFPQGTAVDVQHRAPHTGTSTLDTPRQAATQDAVGSATDLDTSRQGATPPNNSAEDRRYVAQLEKRLEIAKDESDFLREQINRKDRTIESLIERDRETNILVRGLQEMLTPLLGGGRRQDNSQGYTH